MPTEIGNEVGGRHFARRARLLHTFRRCQRAPRAMRCDTQAGMKKRPCSAEQRNGVGRSGSLVADEQVRALCANSRVRLATTSLRQHETTSKEATRVQTRSARLRDLRSGWETEVPMLAMGSRKRPVTARAAYLDATLSGGSLGRPASAQVQSNLIRRVVRSTQRRCGRQKPCGG